MLMLVAVFNGCSDPFQSDVDAARLIFKGKEFDAFEARAGLKVSEAKELVNAYIKAEGLKTLPTGSRIVVDEQYFFATEERNKLGSLSLNGYYVDPVKRNVVFKCPNLTYRPQ